MTKSQFIDEVAVILGVGTKDINLDDRLDSFPSWDSMAKIAVLTLIDTTVGVPVPVNFIENCENVRDLLGLVESKLTHE